MAPRSWISTWPPAQPQLEPGNHGAGQCHRLLPFLLSLAGSWSLALAVTALDMMQVEVCLSLLQPEKPRPSVVCSRFARVLGLRAQLLLPLLTNAEVTFRTEAGASIPLSRARACHTPALIAAQQTCPSVCHTVPRLEAEPKEHSAAGTLEVLHEWLTPQSLPPLEPLGARDLPVSIRNKNQLWMSPSYNPGP